MSYLWSTELLSIVFSVFDTASGDTNENLFDNGKKSALEDLDFLGQDLLQKTKPSQQVLPPV